MDKTTYESIPMVDGSNHWVYLEVYHDLHCLSYLRKFIYSSTNGLITDDNDPWMKYHIRKYLQDGLDDAHRASDKGI